MDKAVYIFNKIAGKGEVVKQVIGLGTLGALGYSGYKSKTKGESAGKGIRKSMSVAVPAAAAAAVLATPYLLRKNPVFGREGAKKMLQDYPIGIRVGAGAGAAASMAVNAPIGHGLGRLFGNPPQKNNA
jgi:hypothetical protein